MTEEERAKVEDIKKDEDTKLKPGTIEEPKAQSDLEEVRKKPVEEMSALEKDALAIFEGRKDVLKKPHQIKKEGMSSLARDAIEIWEGGD